MTAPGHGAKIQPSDFQVKLGDGSVARHKTELRADGLYVFEDELKIGGVLKSLVVTCRAWLLELYEVRAGQLTFTSGEREIGVDTRRFAVFYSPFSVCQPCFRDFEGHLIGFAATDSLPVEFQSGPIVFDVTLAEIPTNIAQVLVLLKRSEHRQAIEMNPKPSLLSFRTKKVIDENYLSNPSISGIAARLGVTPEHLSRQFKRDFTMSPRNYLRQLRVADAPLKLAQGEEIISVSQDVGYNDLSRFYKQFRKTTETSPGVCKTILRRGRR